MTNIARERVERSIYRRTTTDGRTVYEVTMRDADGRQRQRVAGPRLADARALRARLEVAKAEGEPIAATRRLTIAEAGEVWWASTGALRDTTRDSYRRTLDVHVLPAFGSRPLAQLTPDDVAAWALRAQTVAYRVEVDVRRRPDGKTRPTRPYRARHVDLAIVVLGRVYGHAARRQGYRGSNPVTSLEASERPRDADPKETPILAPAELERVIAATDDLYRPLVRFLAHTGCRLGEALALTWGDVDLREGTASITATLTRDGRRMPPKTRRSRRTIDLPRALVADLRARKLAAVDSTDTGWVHASTTGGPLDARNVAQRGLTRACKAAGVPIVHPHALRHAHASALLADGWDIPAVSARLGHASAAITLQVYAHLLDDPTRRAERRTRLDALYGTGLRAV